MCMYVCVCLASAELGWTWLGLTWLGWTRWNWLSLALLSSAHLSWVLSGCNGLGWAWLHCTGLSWNWPGLAGLDCNGLGCVGTGWCNGLGWVGTAELWNLKLVIYKRNLLPKNKWEFVIIFKKEAKTYFRGHFEASIFSILKLFKIMSCW